MRYSKSILKFLKSNDFLRSENLYSYILTIESLNSLILLLSFYTLSIHFNVFSLIFASIFFMLGFKNISFYHYLTSWGIIFNSFVDKKLGYMFNTGSIFLLLGIFKELDLTKNEPISNTEHQNIFFYSKYLTTLTLNIYRYVLTLFKNGNPTIIYIFWLILFLIGNYMVKTCYQIDYYKADPQKLKNKFRVMISLINKFIINYFAINFLVRSFK